MLNLKNKSVLVFGDSIMYGSGNNGFGVGEYLAKSGAKIFKYCVGGARVGYDEGKDWVVGQVKRIIADGVKADYILFDGFTNDCNMTDGVTCDVPLGERAETIPDLYSLTQTDTFSVCFESIAIALKERFENAKILFIRPHKMGRRDAFKQIEYGERAVEICKKHGIAVCDLYKDSGLDTFLPEHRDKYTADSYGWGRGDCTHPNAVGYEKFYMPLIEEAISNL